MKEKQVTVLSLISFLSNLMLFMIKMYIGLASNSISIYSDGINNFFDSLSGLLTLLCVGILMKSSDISSKSIINRTEQLLSFITSVMVAFTGLYFAYSSFERLMYPTPVNYNTKYLFLLVITAFAKLILFFIFRYNSKKVNSSVINVFSADCLLDFFITLTTIFTLLVSASGTYSVDAFCGIAVSIFIVVSAVKLLISCTKKLIGYVPKEMRLNIEEKVKESIGEKEIKSIEYIYTAETVSAFIEISDSEDNKKEIIQMCFNDETKELK